MIAHLSDEQIEAYRRRSLAAAQLLAVSEHIGGCEACRTRLAAPDELAAGIRNVKAALQSTAGSVHLTYEALEAYVDGTMASENRVGLEAHTRDCPSCAADLEALQDVRKELRPPSAVTEHRTPWAEFWKGWLGLRGGLVLAGAAACALVAIVLVRPPPPQSVPPPARAGSIIRDGSRTLSIVAGNRIEGLDPLAEPYRAVLQQALAEKRIEPSSSLADLAANRGVLLGAPNEPARGRLLEPLATVVESQQPVFRWQPIAGATYRVSVYDDGFNVVAESGRISTTEWQVSKPLRRGVRYSWQLSVRQNGGEFSLPVPPAPEARFRVLAEEDEAALARARSQSGDSHLVLGILYARAGLLDQAEQELVVLRAQNPASEEVAGLLASVQRLRRNTQ
ncbi:MAG TPA: zf-HC2 domain-containing protein [Bryobacteraceae bacterium]|jgi:anti-sigma factor RsiW|nr:zf-HC2 domain-containing protein [Bryobacteraceae bacterium]